MRTVRSIVVIISVAIIGIALALAISLEWQRPNANAPQRAGQPAPTNSPPPPREPLVPTQTPAPTPVQQESLPNPTSLPSKSGIPACAFPQMEALTEASFQRPLLSSFIFLTPRVIATGTNAFVPWQWLPDSQRLLVSRGVAGRPVETLEVFDLRTGLFQQYATRNNGAGSKPVWVNRLQAVAYTDLDPAYNVTLNLSTRQGDVKTLSTGLASAGVSFSSDERLIVFASLADDGQIRIANLTPDKTLQILRTPVSSSLTAISRRLDPQYRPQTAWSHDGRRIAVAQGETLLLVDLKTDSVCQIDIQDQHNSQLRVLSDLKWNTDDRHIAMIVSTDETFRHLRLAVVDLLSGETRVIGVDSRNFYSIDWAPRSAVILASVSDDQSPLSGLKNLYMIDATTGEFTNALPGQHLATQGVVWSPDGKSIALLCLLDTEHGANENLNQTCIVPVEIRK